MDDPELPSSSKERPIQGTARPDASQPSAPPYALELPDPGELQGLLGGAYTVECFLGQGGMGAVYKGTQVRLKRSVAIKILRRRGDDDAFAFEDRFKREAYSMASLSHPNIVNVYDCGDAGENFLFISMELVEGGDLKDAMQSGKVSLDVALKLIPQICDGLQAAHEQGIVHRDIKPANIFLTKSGCPKIADFGLAKTSDAKSSLVTMTGLGMGTPDYAAPEQFEGVHDIDSRADIYALGVMMYQMITGILPRGNYKPPSQKVGVDPRIDTIIGKAMEHDRADRYQSVVEIKADLIKIITPARESPKPSAHPTEAVSLKKTAAQPFTNAHASTIPASVPKAVAAHATAQASPPSRKILRIIAIGALLLALAVGAWIMIKPRHSSLNLAGSGKAPLAQATDVLEPPQLPGDLQTTPAFQELKKRGGRLFVEGTIHGIPVDVSSSLPFGDFVEVYASADGWLAKRAGGEALIWITNGMKSQAFREPSVKNVSTGYALSFLTASGALNTIGSTAIEANVEGTNPKSVYCASGFTWRLAFDTDGLVTAMVDLKKDKHPPPYDFFRGAIAFTASTSACIGLYRNKPPKSWDLTNGLSATYPTEFTGCIQAASKGNALVITRNAAGKVLVNSARANNFAALFPPRGLPPAIRVRSGASNRDTDFCAAQMTDGSWRAWGKGSPLLEKVNQIGVALDLDIANADQGTSYAVWIGPEKVPDPSPISQASVTAANQAAPFVNTLGMKFVPVPGTDILMCIHETRKQDYAVYAGATPGIDDSWLYPKMSGFAVSEGNDHPVVMVSWEDAKKFCGWLSKKEGRIYRLPTDKEWSYAVGLGSVEVWTAATTPESLSQKDQKRFPWGTTWPPPRNAANLADASWKKAFPNSTVFVEGYDDGFATTAPVMSFEANALGIHDLGGNVREWVEDWYNEGQQKKVLRGGYFAEGSLGHLLSSLRENRLPTVRQAPYGIRVVLEKVPPPKG